MSTEQPEALRLAAALDELLGYRGINPDVGKAASELRRLHQVNSDLLEALQAIVKSLADQDDEGLIEHAQQMIDARAAIAKATGKKS
jgi:hypothetical protein